MMDDKIRLALAVRKQTKAWLAKQLNRKAPNFYRQLREDNLREKDMIKIAEILDWDREINLILKDTGMKF